MAGLIAVVIISAVAMFAGCIDENGRNRGNRGEFGEPALYTESETYYENGLYKVTGTTYNTGTATAHSAYVHICFTDDFGSYLNYPCDDVPLGDIEPSGKRSFSYDWTYYWAGATVKVGAYCHELP